MRLAKLFFIGSILIFTINASAQTTVTTTGGSVNTIPIFSGSNTIQNSQIFETTSTIPGQTGNFPTLLTPFRLMLFANGGNTGNVFTFVGVPNLIDNYEIRNDLANALVIQSDRSASVPFAVDPLGNVGIGITAPAFNLDVVGKIHASTSFIFPDGTQQTTAFIPANCGADYAEAVDVTGDRTKYEPGDVLVIDPNAPGKFLKSNQAYSGLVAGIYSTQPGFVGRLHPATPSSSATEVPMAMVGRVPTKVSTENGSIKVGDLLVSSSTLGYAMKGTDRSQMLGAVIGKALGSLDSGTGVIEVLVTLQ